MIEHPLTVLDLTGCKAAQRECTFLLAQPIEQWQEPFAAAVFEANHHEDNTNRQA